MRWLILGVFLSSLGGAACGNSPTGPDINGNFRLMLKDSPFSDAKSVLVTFTNVSAHRSGDGGFTTIGSGTRTCDLKKLQTSQDVLGAGTIQNGYYTQIRLVVSSAVIYFDNAAAGAACADSIAVPSGRSAPVEIPSGEIKLNHEFNVPASGATTMVIDFDGDRSIHLTGNGRYMMTPVIEIVSVQ
jgi:hypothetical protein